MMRIATILILMLGLAGMPHHALAAASPALEQQGSWTLKTATTATMTKDYFCANTAVFSHGASLAVARNLIGQLSFVVTVPNAGFTPGAAVPARLAIDGKPLRDIQALARTPEILVVPLGWDEDLAGAFSVAKRLTLTTEKQNLTFNIYDNGEVMARLASCTASLLERAPDSRGLSTEVAPVLRKAGLDAAHIVQMNADAKPGLAENYVIDGIYGGSLALSGDNVQNIMLDYIDRLELLCKSKFDSTLGAPVDGKHHKIVSADATCKNPNTGALTSLVFVENDGGARVFYFESDAARRQQIQKLRGAVAQALQ